MKRIQKHLMLWGFACFALALAGCQAEMNTPNAASDSNTNSTSSNVWGSLTTPAAAANVLSGDQFFDNQGNITTGTMTNRGALDASATFPGVGYYSGTVNNLPLASNIASGVTILGVSGTATVGGSFSSYMISTLFRDFGSSTIPLATELNSGTCSAGGSTTRVDCETAGNIWTPTALAATYHAIPDATLDDDGFLGTNAQYAPRPSSNCGTSGTIKARIADCVTQNPSASTWDGTTQGNGSQAVWKLVTRKAANKEVWQDQRTGLLWSSQVASGSNWCNATGSTAPAPITFQQSYNNGPSFQIIGNGTVSAISGGSSQLSETITISFTSATAFTVSATGGGCQSGTTTGSLTATPGSSVTYSVAGKCSFTITQGTTNFANLDFILIKSFAASTYSCAPGGSMQGASPQSYCYEGAGLSPIGGGETWTSNGYISAKGGMGASATDKVIWRLPTRDDYYQANIDGIRMVLPDMGQTGASRPTRDGSPGAGNSEWTTTTVSNGRDQAWYFGAGDGSFDKGSKFWAEVVRCVGC